MTVSAFEQPRVAIRPLALPAEHGAWSLLLEPVALGLIVAPSTAAGLVAAGAIAAFLARHPLKLALGDRLKGRRYPRTAACEWLAGSYAPLAVAAWSTVGLRPLLILACTIPFGVLELFSRRRSLSAELAGAVAPAAVAAAMLVSSGSALALPIAVLICCRAIPSILYVRHMLHGESRPLMIAAHITAALVAMNFGRFAIAAMVLLLMRALLSLPAPAKTIGLREVGWGVVTVALIAIGL